MPNSYLSLFIVLLLLTGCSSPNRVVASYRSDAAAYCIAHSIEYWQSTGKLEALNAMRPSEKAAALMKTFRGTVKTEAMAQVIFDKASKLPAAQFYPYLQEQIPTLTKQPFDCPAIPAFYVAQ